MTKPRVLAIDDDPEALEILHQLLAREGYEVDGCESAEHGLTLASTRPYDVVLSDVHLGGMGGIELCQRMVAARPDVPVIVSTAFGSLDMAVSALRAGAFDFIHKPVEPVHLYHAIRRATERSQLEHEVRRLRAQTQPLTNVGNIIGESPAMKHVFNLIRQIADTDTSVLVTGESGTGKELVAQALHNESRRKGAPFMAINCAAVPAQLLESELFGHVRGAFTDAKMDKKGLFEQAQHGTVLLDEIGDMPLELQPKLLRVLQERKLRPVGSTREIELDIRIVTATNRNLEKDVQSGRFRADLYYRLNVVNIELPALRQRGLDVLRLAESFLRTFATRMGRDIRGFESSAAQKLLDYAWPGNVRELSNYVERAVNLAQFNQIRVLDLPEKVRTYEMSQVPEQAMPQQLIPLHELQERYIEAVLKSVHGNKTQAAKLLGVDRRTLYRKLERYEASSAPATLT
jgi:two-component system, NtrC family, response regulator AtoC